MDKSTAELILNQTLVAIEALTATLALARERLTPEELTQLQRGIGLAIGEIEMNINVPLYQRFEDLAP